jgi:hypothetical protein
VSRIKKTSDEIKAKLTLHDVDTAKPHGVKEGKSIYSKTEKVKLSVYLDPETNRKLIEMMRENLEESGKVRKNDIWVEAINMLYETRGKKNKDGR